MDNFHNQDYQANVGNRLLTPGCLNGKHNDSDYRVQIIKDCADNQRYKIDDLTIRFGVYSISSEVKHNKNNIHVWV